MIAEDVELAPGVVIFHPELVNLWLPGGRQDNRQLRRGLSASGGLGKISSHNHLRA
jgi:hypothetical protein